MSLSTRKHQRPFVELNATAQRLTDIRTLLATLCQLNTGLQIKRPMLVHCLWQVAVATGNFYARYRSETVIQKVGLKVQRDHICKKKALIAELLGPKPDIEKIIERACCCIVTAEEHKRLHDIDESLDGWDRYRAAGIVIYDMVDGMKIT